METTSKSVASAKSENQQMQAARDLAGIKAAAMSESMVAAVAGGTAFCCAPIEGITCDMLWLLGKKFWSTGKWFDD